jgi:hypothetical protein
MAELLCRNAEVNKCSASVEVFRFAAGHIDGVEVSLEDVIYDGPNAGQPYHYEAPANSSGAAARSSSSSATRSTLRSRCYR